MKIYVPTIVAICSCLQRELIQKELVCTIINLCSFWVVGEDRHLLCWPLFCAVSLVFFTREKLSLKADSYRITVDVDIQGIKLYFKNFLSVCYLKLRFSPNPNLHENSFSLAWNWHKNVLTGMITSSLPWICDSHCVKFSSLWKKKTSSRWSTINVAFR